jgi:hypothetical protein
MLTPRQAQISTLLRANPRGMKLAEIAKRIGLSKQRTGEVLRMLRDLNLAAVTTEGIYSKWTTPDRLQALQSFARENQRKRDRWAERRRSAARAAKREPIRLVRNALDCPPLVPLGPVSVFHLSLSLGISLPA